MSQECEKAVLKATSTVPMLCQVAGLIHKRLWESANLWHKGKYGGESAVRHGDDLDRHGHDGMKLKPGCTARGGDTCGACSPVHILPRQKAALTAGALSRDLPGHS